MKRKLSLTLTPEQGFNDKEILAVLSKKSQTRPEEINYIIQKRSLDARGKNVKVLIDLDLYIRESTKPVLTYNKDLPDVSSSDPVIIVGAGPAGLFGAIKLIENGLKPIIIERGKDVKARRRDIAAINKEHIVNPDSNYCFGEGGAGTFSDGKLYTRSKKRGDVRRILEIFVAYGARENILFEAHPHIGTNKLPQIITNIREVILAAGGEIHFETKVTDFIVEEDVAKGIVTESGDTFLGLSIILATGHSARDIYTLLHEKGILIEAKPFAIGVRAEHPQSLIDQIQYGRNPRGPFLPAAAYSLVAQSMLNDVKRGVFSFCMCPGGFIVPSATSDGEVVVNGMSPSRRDSRFANSGLVVAVEDADWQKYAKYGPLAAMYFQMEIEKKACQVAGGSQSAPAQRMVDFVHSRVSTDLPDCSYQPGLESTELRQVLPESMAERLSLAFKDFGKRMNGYFTNDALLVGVESRTSSPVRIPRDKESCEHQQIKRFYPCGEGAGYAGGIVSAALDGVRCAERLIEKYGTKSPQKSLVS